MYKKLIAPLIILALLISAMALRYNVEASTTMNDSVSLILKWERDRWTGDMWVKAYMLGEEGTVYKISPANNLTEEERDKALAARSRLTLIWWGLVVADLLWLTIICLCVRRKKEPDSRVCG